jgi:8-oxo-dGTP diphosphatase
MTAQATAASVALIDRKKVLLIRRAYAPYQNLWTLPGGRMEAGETAEQCAVREVREELGLEVSGLRHVETQHLSPMSRQDWRLAVFVCTRFSGRVTPSDEIADLAWVALAAVPGMRTTSRLHQLLTRAFALVAVR